MNIYEVSKIVTSESQCKLIRMKKNSTPEQLDIKEAFMGNKKGWCYLDATTASLIVKITEALGDINRAKFLALAPMRVIDVAWRLVK
jgi:hypothetical protein